jgi:hypothetical protein
MGDAVEGGAMLFSAKGTRRGLRINPEVMQETTPLPDLDDVGLVAEPAPVRAPKNRVRFKLKILSKIPFFIEGEAEGLFGITAFVVVLMVFAVALVVSERT